MLTKDLVIFGVSGQCHVSPSGVAKNCVRRRWLPPSATLPSRPPTHASTAQVIVNPVNCKGHMGKGLALAFKQRYPQMFVTYQHECREGKLRIGQPTLYTASTPWILNFPTKDHWCDDSRIEYLEAVISKQTGPAIRPKLKCDQDAEAI